MSLDGKRIVISGIATPASLAAATAAACQQAGAQLVLTAFPRDLDAAREVAATLPDPGVEVLAVDASSPAALDALRGELAARWGHVDGMLHAIAFAPRSALAGSFLDVDPCDAELSFRTSAWSYAAFARVLRDLAPPSGGSLVGLDFDAARAWPIYDWMGVSKAALEAVNRYAARDLGPRRIRSNLVAAGPLHSRAADAIPGFDLLLDSWERCSPVPWDPDDAAPVADAVCFLLSDAARAITGEVLHVDGGHHAMAAPRRSAAR